MEQPPRPSKPYVPGPITEDDLPDKLFDDDSEEIHDTLKDAQPQKPRRVRVKSVERPEPATPKLTNKAKKEARLKAAQDNPEAPESKPTKSKPGKPPGAKKISKTKKPKSKDAAAIKVQCDEVVHVKLADPVMFWREQHSLFAHTDISNMISACLDFADWLALRRTCRAAYLRTSYTKLLKRRTTYLEDKSLDPAVMAKLLKLTLYTNYLVHVLEKKPAAPGKADLSFLKSPIDDNLRRAIFEKTHSINAYKATITGLAKEIASFANVQMVSKMSTELYNNPKFIRGCFGMGEVQNELKTYYSTDISTSTSSHKTNVEVLRWIINASLNNVGLYHSTLVFVLDMACMYEAWSFLEQVQFDLMPTTVVGSWFSSLMSNLSNSDCIPIVEKLKRLALPECITVNRSHFGGVADLIMPMLGYKPLEEGLWILETPDE